MNLIGQQLRVVLVTSRTFQPNLNLGFVQIWSQLRHNATWWLAQSEGSVKCSFFSLFLEDALLLSFVASHIPRFFACPKEKKERKKLATLRTFAGLGGRNCDVRVKHLVTQPGNAPKARPSHLTSADVALVSPTVGVQIQMWIFC